MFTSERPHYLLALFSSFIYTCSTSECHCLRECSRGQKLWSTDLAETEAGCDEAFQKPLWLTSLTFSFGVSGRGVLIFCPLNTKSPAF